MMFQLLFKKKPSRYQAYLYLMLAVVVLLTGSFAVVVTEQASYRSAVKNREASLKLAEELRQSSSDLARLVRTYIITGKSRYKEQFQAIVDIREGRRDRPANYSSAYWEHQAIESQSWAAPATTSDQAIPLVELMKQAGVTQAELLHLKQSKRASDQLVELEQKAIALVEQDVPASAEKKLQALTMLADDNFMAAKAEIMSSIIQTEQMIMARTSAEVATANQRLNMATWVLFALTAILLWLIAQLGRAIHHIIGCSIAELESTITNLGNGDFLTPIPLEPDATDSVLARLAASQRRLAELNLAHFKAIIESSDDAIISKNIQGVVASWNLGAEKIFGYSADEMIGRPMGRIIPPERWHEEPEILHKLASDQKVDHFETQRLHKNGQLVDVSVTISPIYDHNGKVIGASKIARDISKAKQAEAQIQKLAFYDALTGLANRSLLQDRLQNLLDSSLRTGESFAVLFMDLDNFKTLNDTKGHDAGDQLLQQVACRLNAIVRASDTVARFGGDEFVVLLRGPAGDAAETEWLCSTATKIIEEIGQPYRFQDFVHHCTISIGAVIFSQQACSMSDLLKQADQAMYQAKASGKNCLCLYPDQLKPHAENQAPKSQKYVRPLYPS